MDSKLSSTHASNVISRLEIAQAERERETYLQALISTPLKSKVCVPIPLIKSEEVQVFRLKSKEMGLLVSAVRSRYLRSHTFVNHENISICYCPAVLNTHLGTFSMSVVNPTTRDIKVLVEHVPISEARLVISNWPRSVPSEQSLFLSIECEGSDANTGAQLGQFKILWDEEASFKALNVKSLPVINVKIPETDAVKAHFTNRQLDSFLRQLMHAPKLGLKSFGSVRVTNTLLLEEQEEDKHRASTSDGVTSKTLRTVVVDSVGDEHSTEGSFG